MSPQNRERVLRLLNTVWQTARGPNPGATELEAMREYVLRIIDNVIEEEARGKEGG